MPDTNIAFANIVPNSAPASWSQTYNAGKLFAVISLHKEITETSDAIDLNVLGKEVLSGFEQEFFTLENKDLDSIKNAISISLEKTKNISSFSFVITYISGSVLYAFIAGGGGVILKRGSKMGVILEAEDTKDEIKSASGFLHNDDLIVLQTKNFTKIVNLQSLASALDSDDPNSISEALAPKIHEKQDGCAAAVVLLYKDDKAAEALSSVSPKPEPENPSEGFTPNLSEPQPIAQDNFEEISLESLESPTDIEQPILPSEPEQEIQIPQVDETLSSPPLSELVMNAAEKPEEQTYVSTTTKRRLPSLPIPRISLSELSHRRRLLLPIVLVIAVVLGVSIFLGIKTKNDQKVKDQFAQVYPPAQQKFSEGKSLEDLNASLATQDFQDAQKILNGGKGEFKSGSTQEDQIDSLLSQVNQELSKTSNANSAQAQTVSADSSKILSVELDNSSVSYFTQDATNVYFLDGSGIQQVNKSTDKKTLIVKKSWTSEAGIGVFLGNLYVLDKSASQILKFASGSFAKTSYLTGKPDLSAASAMTIDGSVYVLGSDGSISKFLRGASASFTLSGLDKQFSNPTRIFTNADTTNLYVMDNGNSRIVVLDKTGKYIAQYSSSIIKSAKDFEVVEKDKKIYVLSGGKIYQINLK